MPFPPGDMVAALGTYLHFQGLEQALCERHPELAERVHFDESKGPLPLKVALSDRRSVALAQVRMGYTVVWTVLDPVLNSEPFIWPPDTPSDVLVDALHAVASAHIAGEPVPSPWRWNESEHSEMTELADLLDARGVRVRRVAAGNGYFAYGPRHAPKLDIVGEHDMPFVEAEVTGAFVRVSLKPTLGWLVDLFTPRWGTWGRIRLDWCLQGNSSPVPGVPHGEVSAKEIAELLCKGPEAWEANPGWEPSRPSAPAAGDSRSAFQDSRCVAPSTRGHLSDGVSDFPEPQDGPDEKPAPARRREPLSAPEITEAVLHQLQTLGFADLKSGEAGTPMESDAFHIEWRSSGKDLSTSEIQRLNGLAAAAGEASPKRLLVITRSGMSRPAAAFADKARAFVFRLDPVTGRLTALNSRAREALLPTEAPGTRVLEPW